MVPLLGNLRASVAISVVKLWIRARVRDCVALLSRICSASTHNFSDRWQRDTYSDSGTQNVNLSRKPTAAGGRVGTSNKLPHQV
jgi:hypothetical protein